MAHPSDSRSVPKNQSGALRGQVDESLQQSVVDAVHLLPESVRRVV